MRARTAIAAALVAASAAAVAVWDGGADADGVRERAAGLSPVHVDGGAGAAAWRAAARDGVRGCLERIVGRVAPAGPADTTIGPITFSGLPRAYRYSSSFPPTPIKSIVRLRPGFRVELVVPRRQRGWLQVWWGARDGRPHVAVMQACRRFAPGAARARECGWGSYAACAGGDTLFSGGVGVDFAAAPRRGLCAELIVRVAGGHRLRDHLFAPAPGECGRSARKP